MDGLGVDMLVGNSVGVKLRKDLQGIAPLRFGVNGIRLHRYRSKICVEPQVATRDIYLDTRECSSSERIIGLLYTTVSHIS